MPDDTPKPDPMLAYVSAWDERKRLFEAMRDLRLDDNAKTQLKAEYKKACREFERQRQDFLK